MNEVNEYLYSVKLNTSVLIALLLSVMDMTEDESSSPDSDERVTGRVSLLLLLLLLLSEEHDVSVNPERMSDVLIGVLLLTLTLLIPSDFSRSIPTLNDRHG